MLYLEDYLEMIEHLPQELRDRFTEMRELDLTVQNNMDSLEKKTRSFFLQCKRGELQNGAADNEYQSLRKEYYKVLEDADEKVTIATQIHDLVERYLRRLDSELFKFKCELEADNNGITEILEKRSLEMDGGSTAMALMNMICMKENRYFGAMGLAGTTAPSNNHVALGSASTGGVGLAAQTLPVVATVSAPAKAASYRTPKPEKRRDSTSSALSGIPEKRPNLGGNSLAPAAAVTAASRPLTPGMAVAHAVLTPSVAAVATPSSVTYNLQHMPGSASNAIAAAASQAIVATQQMQQGRRTASLKASYEAIHGAAGGPTEFWISRDMTGNATAPQNTLQTVTTEKKQKKKLNASLAQVATSNVAPSSTISLASSTSSVSVDSVDMLPTSSAAAAAVAASASAAVNVATIGLHNIAGASSNVAVAANRANVAVAANMTSVPAVASLGTSITVGAVLNENNNGLVVEQSAEGEWSYDPNEPRYCTCNQVSYGDMVACDNDACPYEWFHYPCVGITQPPKGKWYCPKCTSSMRRRGNRKN